MIIWFGLLHAELKCVSININILNRKNMLGDSMAFSDTKEETDKWVGK